MKIFVYYPQDGEGGSSNGEGGVFFVSFDGSAPLGGGVKRQTSEYYSIAGETACEFPSAACMQWRDVDAEKPGVDVEFRDLLISQGRFWDSFGYG